MTGSAFREDIEQVVSDRNIPWQEMSGTTVFITGVTGLIGSALVGVLVFANEKYGLDLRIIGHGRNAAKGDALCREYEIEFIGSDICKPIPTETLPQKLDYIFHCAAITKSADMVAKPVEVITTSLNGTHNILELAREKNTISLVYLSSMEVYGQTGKQEVAESDLGCLDLMNPRSSYPESKRQCENMCVCYCAEYGVPVKIARLSRIFGAGTQNYDSDKRVAMQFARKAMAKKDIVLHTSGTSMGNCCYTSDAVSGLLIILLKAVNGEAYNVSNPAESVSIRKEAELVANEVCGGDIAVAIEVPHDIDKFGYAPVVGHKLNADKLKKLGWSPQYPLVEMYRRMIIDWDNVR